jgi:hypothetical protein
VFSGQRQPGARQVAGEQQRVDCGSATAVARRAGHSVAVLLKVSANCIDGQATAVNHRISDALDEGGASDLP